MIYELKRYMPQPGKGPALKERFARVTMPIFARLGIQVLHCWEDAADRDAFVYLVAFDDAMQRDAAWKAFGADKEWIAAKAASEIEGPLLASQTTIELHPMGFSPALGSLSSAARRPADDSPEAR